ncbi:MAG: lipopolysaccharide heptosyltransferase II, partial [Gammaproteobacteria bacterium]|nr:lipopolysaccharide heptosyltransferase II [Gammaproteobacteria bacterium]
EFRHGLLNDARRLDKQAMPRLVERYAALAFPPSPTGGGAGGEGATLAPPQPRLSVNPEAQQASLARLGLVLGRPILALCPGAEFGPAKRWPEAHYVAVARAKLRDGWQVWLFGSAKDQPVTEAIAALAGEAAEGAVQIHNLAGRTSLEETVDLLACATCVVSNDSGLMHIAAAVDVPVIALYGSTDPGYTPPFSTRARVLRLGLECSPCFKRVCPLGHLDCLKKLGPEQVLEALPE